MEEQEYRPGCHWDEDLACTDCGECFPCPLTMWEESFEDE